MMCFPLEFLPLSVYMIGTRPGLHKQTENCFFLAFESDGYQNTASALPICCFTAFYCRSICNLLPVTYSVVYQIDLRWYAHST